MSRRYGKIATTIWSSRRFNDLRDPNARLGYIYVHTNNHGNCNGCYRLPRAYMAADLRISVDQAEAAMNDLARVGLIQYDPDEEVVRICGWWPFNPITNRKHLSSAITEQRALPRTSPLSARIAFEIADSMLSTARNWATDAKGVAAMNETLTMLRDMLRDTIKSIPESTIRHALDGLPIELSQRLSEGLAIPLNEFRSETETDDRRQRQTTETETETETDLEIRSEPTQALIDALNERAGARS